MSDDAAGLYRPMDFVQKTQFFTLDVISALAFGVPFGYLARDEDLFDYIRISTAYIPFMMVSTSVPWVAGLLHSKLPSESDKLGFGAFIGVARRVVAERFEPGVQPQLDMLGSFIRHGLSPEEASSEALLQIVAGSDTSASAIRAVVLYLVTNPTAYGKLQAEIDAEIAEGMVSSAHQGRRGKTSTVFASGHQRRSAHHASGYRCKLQTRASGRRRAQRSLDPLWDADRILVSQHSALRLHLWPGCSRLPARTLARHQNRCHTPRQHD